MPVFRLLLACHGFEAVSHARVLEAAGYLVDRASDGREALSAAVSKPYDLIVIHTGLPAPDGLTVAREIRKVEAERRWPTVPIVGLIPGDDDEARARCLAAGMGEALRLPLARAQLLALAERWTPESTVPFLADMIPGYLEGRRREAVSMSNSLMAGRFEDIRAMAHRLKGTGGTYGFPRLTSIGARLEIAAERERFEDVARAIDALHDELSRATPLAS